MPTTKVIDLSHFNTIPASLQPAAASGVLGVIHKLTQGTSYTDPKVAARAFLTAQAGMLWGVYCYLNPSPLRPQIDYFWGQGHMLGVIDRDTLLCLDYEENNIPLDQLLDALAYLQSLSERSPVLYSGHVLKDKGGAVAEPALLNYRLWLAQYASIPVLPAGYSSWWLWQFTDQASIPGITGPVDANAYERSDLQLNEAWAGTPTLPTRTTVTITVAAPPEVEVRIVRI